MQRNLNSPSQLPSVYSVDKDPSFVAGHQQIIPTRMDIEGGDFPFIYHKGHQRSVAKLVALYFYRLKLDAIRGGGRENSELGGKVLNSPSHHEFLIERGVQEGFLVLPQLSSCGEGHILL